MKKIIVRFWPLILIAIFTFLLRIIKLEELFYFTYDESVFAFVARRFALWNHIPLIGGVTPFGAHVAPYFYWFFSLTLFLGNLNPIVWGYVAAALAVLTTLMMYIVGTTFFSKKVGFLAASLWSFSYLANIYDRHFWGLNFGPLFSLIVIYCLYRIIKGNERFVYLLGVIIALIIHSDLSYYIFLILAVIIWFIYRLPIKKSSLIAAALVIFSFLPLVVFDLRHNFANTRPVINFIQQGNINPGFKSGKLMNSSLIFPRAFSRLVYTFGDNEVAKQYSYSNIYITEKYNAIPVIFLLIFAICLFGFVLWSFRNNKVGPRLLSILAILYFLGIQIYGTVFKADIFEHYITGVFSVLLLIAAFLLSKLPRKLWILVLIIFVILNLYKLINAKNSMGLMYKQQAIGYTLQQIGNRPFSLDSLSTNWKYSGYRYLFAAFGREPVKSYVDPNFAYLYGATPVTQKHPSTVVVFIIHDFNFETDQYYRRYALLKSHEISNALFGNIEVVIMDNSTNWFEEN